MKKVQHPEVVDLHHPLRIGDILRRVTGHPDAGVGDGHVKRTAERLLPGPHGTRHGGFVGDITRKRDSVRQFFREPLKKVRAPREERDGIAPARHLPHHLRSDPGGSAGDDRAIHQTVSLAC